MTELLTAAQMRAIEQAAIESGAVTGLELMERAGQGVVEVVLEEWPELALTSHKAVVLCGPGNNGGDGFVVARLLKARGWDVEVFLYGEAEELPPVARVNYERWLELGVVNKLDSSVEPSTTKAAIVIDALFGTGLSRPIECATLRRLFLDLCDCVDSSGGLPLKDRIAPIIVAIDMPSGLCSDSGRALTIESYVGLPKKLENRNAAADLTVSFHSRKIGHWLALGPQISGKLRVADIGILRSAGRVVPTFAKVRVARVGWLGRRCHAHKFSHGHALILSGPAYQSGAARLAARGALRIGAGVVTIGAPPEAMAENAAQLNAIMLKPVADVGALVGIFEELWINALCSRPGSGLSLFHI